MQRKIEKMPFAVKIIVSELVDSFVSLKKKILVIGSQCVNKKS